MATFRYTAKNAQGHTESGQVDAANSSDAAHQLRERGLFVMNITSGVGERPRAASPGGRSREGIIARLVPPVGVKQRLQFWTQLHSVLASGMSFSEGLAVIAANARGHIRPILQDSVRRTADGEPLSSILASYPGSFPRTEVALIRAGEHGGTTVEAVASLIEINDQELRTRRDFTFQLLYPILTLLCALFIPLLPMVVLGDGARAIQIICRCYIPAGLIFVLVILAFRLLFVLLPATKVMWDSFKLHLPGTGAITQRMATAKFADVLAAGFRSGLDMAVCVELAGQSCGNEAMAVRVCRAANAVRAGHSLTSALADVRVLPPRAMQLLATGEKSGNVDTMMQSVSSTFRSEAYAALRIGSVVAGLLALLAVAVYVGIIVVNFYTGYAHGLGNAGGQ